MQEFEHQQRRWEDEAQALKDQIRQLQEENELGKKVRGPGGPQQAANV